MNDFELGFVFFSLLLEIWLILVFSENDLEKL